jgi:hypothetical protein
LRGIATGMLNVCPGRFEEAHPITAHDGLNIGFFVTSLAHESGYPLDVNNCVQISGTLFRAVASVKVTSNRGMASIAGELTNVVNVIDNGFEADYGIRGFSRDPLWIQHPGIERNANHCVALNQTPKLIIGKLPITRH